MRAGWTTRSPSTGTRYGSTPSSAGPNTCSASPSPPGAAWTKQTTAISGLSATTPCGPRPKKRPALMAVDQGIINYQRALGIDPNATLSRGSLGLTPGDADRLKEAIGHYESAVRIEPWLWMAHAARGQALLALGRFREAEAATRRCLDRLPQDHERRSNVLAQLDRCERLIVFRIASPQF